MPRMHGFWAPALWLVRYLTGYRLRHAVVAVLALAVALAAIAVPFWWLGEQADAAIGPLGLVILAMAYLYAAASALAVAAVLVVRLLVGRLGRLFA
jgi:hypothetical protein